MEETTEMRKEGDLAFPTPETETPEESSPETNEADKTEVVEQDNTTDEPKEKEEEPEPKEKIVPLHKDERFREVLEENKKMKEQLEDLSEFKSKVEPFIKEKETIEIPSWFGGDENSYKAYLADRDKELNQAEERAFKRFNEQKSTESKMISEANQYLDDQVREIEETEGNKIDRNKLLKIVMDKELIDSKGRWNYKAGYEFLKLMEKPKETNLDEKKKLAASTTSDTKPEEKPRDFKTQEDFKLDRPW